MWGRRHRSPPITHLRKSMRFCVKVPVLSENTCSTRPKSSTKFVVRATAGTATPAEHRVREPVRLLLKDPGGWGGCLGPWPARPTHPPTRIRNTFLRQKVKFIKGAGNLRPAFGTQTFFLPLTHPTHPPARGGSPFTIAWS